jgi:regulator of sigma E protease
VGTVQPGSLAQRAGIAVGDKILTLDGRVQHDFTKIGPNVALAESGQPLQVTIEGRKEPITVIPRKSAADPNGFLQLGIMAMPSLRGPDPNKLSASEIELYKDEPLRPGETIVAVNGQPVGPTDYPVLDRAIQQGKPVDITVEDAQGQRHQRQVEPVFIPPFDDAELQFAGMAPRTVVSGVETWSSAKDKLLPDDIIDEVVVQPVNDLFAHPAMRTLRDVLNRAGQGGSKVDLTVIRDGQRVTVTGLDPSKKVADGRKGLGIGLNADIENAVVADVMANSAAQRAGIPAGAKLQSIDGQPVQDWRDVQRIVSAAEADKPLSVALVTRQGQAQTVELRLSADQLADVRQNRYTAGLVLRELTDPPRRTTNPFTAAAWGVGETRDLMVQFYLTLRRMAQGSVSPKQAMGPIGIFHHGSKIAYRGIDWVIWFLAMISANLAVVNFLPVPIVDGGLFLFLILEKIMGKPLSPRAQGIAQLVGLALIAGVFLFVTYNDISRLF